MSLSAWIAAGRKDVKAEDVPRTKGEYPTYPGMETVAEPGKLGGVDFLRWVSLVLNDPSLYSLTWIGPFKLALRLYVPRESVRDGSWVPPAVERAD